MKIGFKIWLLIAILIISILAISPSFEKGILIRGVEQNSTSYESGLRTGMIIKSVNNQIVNTPEDYNNILNNLFPSSENIKLNIQTKDSEFILFINQSPEISVSSIPKTNIKTGLDLSGGARALVKPEGKISQSELNDLVTITNNRLNAFGIADVSVRAVSDLSGDNFMLVEIAGATPEDLNKLLSEQGKFEAKIGNSTVFIGGDKDITYVARTGEQSGIYSCETYSNGDVCSFRFAITLSEDAAKKQASITETLSINSSNPEYLNETLKLYLDDSLVDELSISKDLKGQIATQISIQGSGSGANRQEAYDSAVENMKHLQTILITGSLPFKLEIVKLDTISPTLGKEFTKNLIYLAILVFAIICLVIFIKYRRIKITLAVIMTMASEAIITLGIAALIHWNLDAPSIAGIIAGLGTGVDDQIILIDETLTDKQSSLKQRIRNALFIIFGAFFLTFASLIPLLWAGAGLLKGFALTTLIGISAGVLITRPAFAEILKRIQKE